MSALALVLTALLAASAPTLPDIEDEVMCVVCGTALNVSSSDSAEQQRQFIRNRIADGMSKDEIKDALVEEYGPSVLAVPEREGVNWGVYLVPGLLLVAALAFVVRLVGRRRGGSDAAPGAAGDAELDPEASARLDAELAAFDK